MTLVEGPMIKSYGSPSQLEHYVAANSDCYIYLVQEQAPNVWTCLVQLR